MDLRAIRVSSKIILSVIGGNDMSQNMYGYIRVSSNYGVHLASVDGAVFPAGIGSGQGPGGVL